MKKITFVFFLLMCVSYAEMYSQAGSASATYTAGNIATDHLGNFASPSPSDDSSCFETLTVNIPSGKIITGVDVSYEMTTSEWMSELRSRIKAVNGEAESSYFSGTGNSAGTQTFSRSNLSIANNITGGGNIDFEMHAFRTYGGSGCGTSIAVVDNNSWTVTVYYDDPPSCAAPTNVTASNLSTSSVAIAWDAVAEATNGYQWRLMADGDDVEVDEPVDSGTAAAGVTEATATNIAFGATYQVYVKSDCDTDGQSVWATTTLLFDYCPSAATNGDDSKIAQVAVADDERNSPVGSGNCATYTDNTSAAAFEVKRLDPTAISVTRGTCNGNYAAAVRVYIDLNQDGVLDAATEMVFEGTMGNTTSTATASGVLNIPNDAELGTTLMRFVLRETGDVNVLTPCGPAGTGTTYGETQDYIINIAEEDNCLIPSGVTVSNVTDTEAQISWTDSEPGNGFQYAVSTVNEVPTDIIQITPLSSLSLSDLDPNTTYFIFIRSDCGGGEFSNWSPPTSFTTECDVDLPIVQNFDDVTTPNLPECWSSIAVFSSFSGGVTTTSSFTPVNSSPNHLLLTAFSTTTNLMLISPLLKQSMQGNQYLVKFSAKATTAGQTLEVGTMTNKTDANTFVGDETVTLTTTYQEFSLIITTTNPYMVFRRGNVNTASVLLDDIVIQEAPTCIDPTDLSATNITATTADLGWTADQGQTAWNIEITEAGATPTGTPTAAGVSNPSSATGLSPNTSYEFYVQADCGNGDVSAWVGPFAFATPCEPLATFPYTDSFENAGAISDCWSQEYVSASVNWVFVNANNNTTVTARTGDYLARFFAANNSDNTTKLIMPTFDLSGLTNPAIKFYYTQVDWSGDQDELRVYYKTSADGDWNLIEAYTSSVTNWTEVTLELPNPTSEYYIAFEGTSKWGRGVTIDDVTVDEFSTLGLETPVLSTFQYHPNPVKNTLTLNAQNNIEQVTVFNMLGQAVLKLAPNTTTFEVDMTTLGSGTYFAQVTINNIVKTVKVVKQ